MQPVRNAVAPMGREHDEVAPMLAQKVDDGLRRFLQFDAYVVDFDSELARDRPWRIILVGEPPLREQALCVRKRQGFVGVVLGHVQEVQFASCRQGDAQRMGKRRGAQVGKIGGMHDGANGVHCNCSY